MKQPLSRAIEASLSISLPVAGTFLLNMLTSFIAVFYMSRFGESALAASALIFSVQVTTLVMSMSILFSISVMAGRAYASNNNELAARLLQQGWILGFGMSIIIVIIFLMAPKLLLLFHQPKNLVAIATLYFHAIIFAAVPVMLQTCNAQFAIGVTKQKLVALSSFIGLLTMSFLGYGLGFGKFGLPKLGMAGIGYAIAAQYWVAFIFLLMQFKYNRFFQIFKVFKPRPLKGLHELMMLFKIGWPISMQIGTELLAIFFITIMAGWLGKLSLSARQVTTQFLVFTIVPIIGIAQASGVLVSQNIGKKQFHEVGRIVNINSFLAFSFIIWFLLAFLFIPNKLASLYINIHDPTNIHLLYVIRILFLIACFSQIFDSIRNVTSGALRGLYDTQFPMVAGIIGLWLIALPLGYILAFPFHLGVIGLNLAFAIGVAVSSILQLWRWRIQSEYANLERKYT